MATEKKSENTPTPAVNDNKTVFGPLVNYAIVAVIMVSIIVTTAIMLDRQLNTVDKQIAAIEEEVTEIHEANIDTNAEAATIEQTALESTASASTEIKEQVTQEAVAITVATETKHKTAQTDSAAVNQFKLTSTKTSDHADQQQAHHAQLAKDNQARIETYKLEQKKHMTDMFARIKALESQRLDRYKANQDDQIVRLREQIVQQQQMIEVFVLRNKDLFELRAANMQRNQAKREQILNRI